MNDDEELAFELDNDALAHAADANDALSSKLARGGLDSAQHKWICQTQL